MIIDDKYLENLLNKKEYNEKKIIKLNRKLIKLKNELFNINEELKIECPHNFPIKHLNWDGHKNDSYYDCDTCSNILLYHQIEGKIIKQVE